MIEIKFYETYYFCNIINNVIEDPFSYLRKLDEFYGNENIFNLVKPFKKYSTFHFFIEFVIDDVYRDVMSEEELESKKLLHRRFIDIPEALADIQPTKLLIEEAFEFHDIEYFSFAEYLDRDFLSCTVDDIYEYMCEIAMSDEYCKLIEQTTIEVFHILYQNRVLMLKFNQLISSALSRHKNINPPEEIKSFLKEKNKIRRQNIPKWVQRAVFFRDRGRCVLCNKDISGVLNLENKVNYDHIIPLDKYGFNDISNIQLLCSSCNQKKKANPGITSTFYQSWYSYETE